MKNLDSKELLADFLKSIELADENMLQVPAKLDSSDKVVGQIEEGDILRKMFVLSLMYKKQSEEFALQVSYDEDNLDLKKQAVRYQNLSELLRDLFYVLIREKHDLWEKDAIGVRRGWKVVTSDSNEPQLPDFLKRLFGG